MKRGSPFPILVSTALAIFICVAGQNSFAQASSARVAAQPGVVLVKLTPPIYPQISRTVRISGEVDVVLGIRQDGSVESAKVVSGPPLLQQAALDSAQQSQFKCTECSEAVTSYSLVYTFQLDTSEQKGQYFPQVIQLQNRITLIDRPVCLCDPPGHLGKFRTAKCLYLWRCGYR